MTKSLSRAKTLSSLLQNAQISNTIDNFISDTSGWVSIDGIYNAKEGEQFIVVGNFQKCNQTSRKVLIPNKRGGVLKNIKRKFSEDLNEGNSVRLYNYAYYFIDNISLTPYELNDSISYLSQHDACQTDDLAPNSLKTNLIKDGSFDLNKEGFNTFWRNPNKGTPDFLENKMGIYLYSDLGENNRVYIISQLKSEIQPCFNYYL
ncbi:MAG: hypothetical protein ACI9DK_000136 [Vicingaceae bacterium]|jgi:hypothetical protein